MGFSNRRRDSRHSDEHEVDGKQYVTIAAGHAYSFFDCNSRYDVCPRQHSYR